MSTSSNSLIIKWGIGIATAIAVLGALWFVYASYAENAAQKDAQDAAARQAAADVAKSSNPFKTSNPLSGVEANPFEKTKKVMNPFEQ